MKIRKSLLIVFLLCSLRSDVLAQEGGDDEGSLNESHRNEEAVADALRPVLRSLGGGVRIDYDAACRETSDKQKTVWFPRVNVRPASRGMSGIEALRQIFEHDNRVVITRGSAGVIRIQIGTVTGALLQTTIPLLKFDSYERYNPSEALSALETTSEFQSAMDKLHLFEMPVIVGGPLQEPEPNLPHLPPVMKDVTVGQVLDAVANTFGGIVAYGECVNPVDKTLCFSLIYIYPKALSLPPASSPKSAITPNE